MKEGSASGALAWTYVGTLARILCQFGVGISVARILGPKPYGLIASSLIVVSLAQLVADGGISASLIHHRDATDREVAGAFWVQIVLGLLLGSLICIGASLLCRILKAPEATQVMRVTTLAFPINAFAGTSMALLRRRLEARILQLASVTSYLIAYGGVCLTMALMGFEEWSLVAAFLSQAAISTAIIHLAVRPPWRNPEWPKRLFGFGGWTILNNMTNWVHGNALPIVLTRIFGVHSLGQYNRLALITDQTVPVLGGPLQQVLFPALSRAADSKTRRQRLVQASFRLIGLLFIPAMGVMACFPDEVVKGLFGHKFSGESSMLAPMALATIGMVLKTLTGPILNGAGKPRNEWVAQILSLPLLLSSVLVFSTGTVTYLCWGLCLGVWLRFLISIYAACKAKVISIKDVTKGVLPAIPPALSGLGGMWFGLRMTLEWTPEARLLLASIAALTSWLTFILLTWRWTIPAPLRERIEPIRLKLFNRS